MGPAILPIQPAGERLFEFLDQIAIGVVFFDHVVCKAY
jgi:hypothetical protein